MSDFLSIQDAVKQFTQKPRIRNGINTAKIQIFWHEIVDAFIAKNTDKVEIINQTLYIYTSVAALKNELFIEKKNIIQKVNDFFKEIVIKEIRFK